jgi:hypothetical protein
VTPPEAAARRAKQGSRVDHERRPEFAAGEPALASLLVNGQYVGVIDLVSTDGAALDTSST